MTYTIIELMQQSWRILNATDWIKYLTLKLTSFGMFSTVVHFHILHIYPLIRMEVSTHVRTHKTMQRVKGFPDPSLSQCKTSVAQMLISVCLIQQQMEISGPCLSWVKYLHPPSSLSAFSCCLWLCLFSMSVFLSLSVSPPHCMSLSWLFCTHRAEISWKDCLFMLY